MSNTNEMMLPGFDNMFEVTSSEKEIITDAKPAEWPAKDVKALSDFCKKNNVSGFDCGRMSPIAALALLKRKLGWADSSLSERVPFDGKKSINNPYYTYQDMVQKKTLLHG